jgi:hypothetical protein
MNDILFASVDLPILDKTQATNDLLGLDECHSWWDKYRHTKMIPLMTRDGVSNSLGISNARQGDFRWVEHAPKGIINWFEKVVFPWAGTRSRVMALITQPGFMNKEHIDCEPHELGSRQHKFRIVLQGQTDTLYFKTSTGDIYVPAIEGPFVMDGSWPHGMVNHTNNIKVTLALGAPWNGQEEYNESVKILMKRSSYKMLPNLNLYWNKYY